MKKLTPTKRQKISKKLLIAIFLHKSYHEFNSKKLLLLFLQPEQNISFYKLKMEFTQKTPSLPNDFSLMVELANQFREDSFHVSDLPYRFSSWALDDPENSCLWSDSNGNLLAWAVMQTPFWTVDLVLNPQFARYLLPRILAWIDQRARSIRDGQYGHSAWYIPTFSEQSNFIRILEKAGFICQSFLEENACNDSERMRSDY